MSWEHGDRSLRGMIAIISQGEASNLLGVCVGLVKFDALIKKTHEAVCNIITAKSTILVSAC